MCWLKLTFSGSGSSFGPTLRPGVSGRIDRSSGLQAARRKADASKGPRFFISSGFDTILGAERENFIRDWACVVGKSGRRLRWMHSPDLTPCPWLPSVEGRLGPDSTRRFGNKDCGFYLAALRYSQSLWLEGKPAQAILQLNKAWMADLKGDEPVLLEFPPPYRALGWMLVRIRKGGLGFSGDPLRHFQHLASRMSGPRAEIRSWRAWACFWIAAKIFEGAPFFRDGVQLAREGLWIPSQHRVQGEIRKLGWEDEEEQFAGIFNDPSSVR